MSSSSPPSPDRLGQRAPVGPSLSPGPRSSLPPSLRPPAKQCRRHQIVLRPDGSCVVCDREGGPHVSMAPPRGQRRPSAILWVTLGAAVLLGGGLVVWSPWSGAPPDPTTSSGQRSPSPQAAQSQTPSQSQGVDSAVEAEEEANPLHEIQRRVLQGDPTPSGEGPGEDDPTQDKAYPADENVP